MFGFVNAFFKICQFFSFCSFPVIKSLKSNFLKTDTLCTKNA